MSFTTKWKVDTLEIVRHFLKKHGLILARRCLYCKTIRKVSPSQAAYGKYCDKACMYKHYAIREVHEPGKYRIVPTRKAGITFKYDAETESGEFRGVTLRAGEAKVLKALICVHGIVTIEEISEFLWPNPDNSPDYHDDNIKQYISRLRIKFGKEFIINHNGQGYELIG